MGSRGLHPGPHRGEPTQELGGAWGLPGEVTGKPACAQHAPGAVSLRKPANAELAGGCPLPTTFLFCHQESMSQVRAEALLPEGS